MAQNDDSDIKNGFNSLKDGSTNSTAIAAYYDDWAETYDATLIDWDYQAPEDAAVALGEYLKSGDSILDVGCGTGMFASALSRHLDCRIEGIDISAASLEIAEKHGQYDRLQRHDLQVTPLPAADNAFDAAACVGVMTYIEDAAALLADMCRVVQPGGYILFTQRDDRWIEKEFDSLIKSFEERRLWTPLKISKAKPYLPKNDDFSDSIRVIQVLCQVA
ncbi:MAG: methyltransferase domain-containing protein [Alphaproteobacteria bacterium]|jgi:predicted TPR repeat methyltransferase|nr:methyltransferase domain-containing protein [Alphaproteobacteria bacterium]MBT4966138.1 methyltransferase domain-containing protein [Alphaproteobacteria bacterium]MBT5158669.1 methyltransferase domain-containing protein [Alphaproteobacteria bacterium]MBT6388121.1 methyltransferase domain-containing protein [Alphaproteobacteria bacterium]